MVSRSTRLPELHYGRLALFHPRYFDRDRSNLGLTRTLTPPYTRDANPIPKEATEGSSGLDQMRAIRDGRLGVAPMQALMNMRLIEVEDGRVVVGGTPEEKHHNPGGTVHAAFKAAVLDSVMGLVVRTMLPPGVGQTTIEFKLNMVRPMSADI
jgi:hypothetical protein